VIAALLASALAGAAPAAAPALVAPAENRALAVCLAHAARTDAYRDIPTEALAQDAAFLKAVSGRWCAEEAAAYWPVAHEAARTALGLPEGAPYQSDKQRLAEANMDRMMGEAWAAAAPLRAAPPPMAAPRRAKFKLVWTLENLSETSPVGLATKPAVTCLAGRLREDQGTARALGEAVSAGRTLDLALHAEACGHGAAVAEIGALMAASLPGDPPETYTASAEGVLQSLLFFATLAQPK
jgi:hypothetical protein